MKFAKIMVIIVIFVFAMSVSCAADTNNASISEDNSQMLLSLKNEITDDTSENSILAQTNNDETLSAQKNSEILRANEGNYSDLRDDIFNNGGNLKKSYYLYQQGDGETIVIRNDGFTINGNGAVIDMNGSNIRAFNVTGSGVTFKNLTIKNANFDGSGGAIYFSSSGTVSNCNFTGNNATGEGGAINMGGGAVYFNGDGNVRNCNFTGNTATGTYSEGGAVYFVGNGNVGNCNFTGNTATTGSAIYFYSTSAQKSVSNSTFLNNRANAKDLQVTKNENNITIIFTGNNNILNAIYSRNDAEVSFSNVTYWGANGIVNTDTFKPPISNNAAGQNITVSIVINDKIDSNEVYVTDENGKIVLNRNVGDNYFIGVCHDTDSYYTEILNSTSKNTKFSVNVNNQTSNNRRVNITAKSNIPNEVLKGKLLFILPNSTQINANYTSNGTWWAVHEFDDACDYVINASYIGLDGVIINNATISIRYDASVDVNNKTLDLFVGDTFTIVANTTPKGLNVTYVPDDSGVYDVDKSGVVTALKNGTGSVLVKIGGDGVYAENSTIVTVTVTKVPTEIKVTNTTLNLEVNDEIPTGATLSPADAGNLTYNLSNEGIVKIEDGEIIALKEGNVTITVSFKGNNKYLTAENKTINVTVSLKNTRVSVNNNTLDLFVDNTFTIVANTTPKGLKVTYKPDNSGIISVDNNGVVKALKEGNTTIIVSVGDNKVYAENTTTVTVTVSKIPTEILITNETLDLKVNDKVDSGVSLNPSEAGNLTYTISETSIIKLLDNQIIALSEGSATISYSFAGNDKYAAAQNKTITVKVSLNDASVSVNNNTLNLLIDDTFTIVATTVPDGLNVTYMPDNLGIISVDENGMVTALKEGTAPIIVKVGGDGVYAENTTIVTVTVKKVNPTMDASADEITEGENATINVELPIDATGNVTTTVNGKTYFSPVDNGKAIITIPCLEYGNYTLPVTYSGDDKYNSLTKDVNLTVKEDEIVVSAPDLTKYYSGHELFNVNVAYANGRAIAGKEVKITINGITYTRTTDEKGTASLNINLNSGVYPVVVAVDDVVVNSSVFVKATIDSSDVVKVFRNDTQYYATFVDVNGTPTPNTTVSFNVNDVIYNRTTDDNGTAKLNINLPSGEYILTATNTATGEKMSNVIKVLSVIESSDLTKYFRNASQFIVRIHTADGGYVGAGEEVRFNINGMIYAKKTNATGHAKLNINLGQGNYTVTTYYKNYSQGNSIEVLPTLTAEDLSMKYMDGSQFKAQLVDGKGKPYPKQDVTFNINGVFYNRATDSDGVAKLNIRLLAGQYIITSSYNGCNIANKITIRG